MALFVDIFYEFNNKNCFSFGIKYVLRLYRMRRFALQVVAISVSGFLLLGDAFENEIVILAPSTADTLSYDFGRIFLVSVSKEMGNELVVSTQWEKEKLVSLATKNEKENFPRTFYQFFEPKTTIQLMTYSLRFFSGYSTPETLSYSFADTMSLRTFWQTAAFANLVTKVQSSEATSAHLHLIGWKDSVVSTQYDDPNNDTRALYKLHVQLIAGNNSIFFSERGKKMEAREQHINCVTASSALSSRSSAFHNSAISQHCTACHEGMPSEEDTTLVSDCSVCHKSYFAEPKIHSPVELRECTACHRWSSEHHSIVVAEDVPAKCYECHSEIQSYVENSSVQHPVASDCITCHSPHSSKQNALLKNNVFTLCVSCHEEYTMNHPVGRHPLRFAAYGEKKEEISCVSCHNPHGSQETALLKISGGPMAICTQCH
jgi:predicted CXXCH cytochrome family protein